MNHFTSLLNGLGTGALAMYFLDPARGRYRRALVRDQCNHWMRGFEDAIEVGWRDLGNRTSGWVSELQSASRQHEIADDTLQARVRSKMGRAVSHPRAIEVQAQQGNIELKGDVLASELQCLLDCVRRVPGVQNVDNQLQVHEHAENHPALQGEGRATGGNPLAFNPGTQLLIGSAACLAVTYAFAKRAPLITMLGTAAFIAMAAESRAIQHQRMPGSRSQRRQGENQTQETHQQNQSEEAETWPAEMQSAMTMP